MYRWRSLSDLERIALTEWRQSQKLPKHSPPHLKGEGTCLLTAACYEHEPVIGANVGRMLSFSEELTALVGSFAEAIHAWVVLPNHYHILLTTPDLKATLKAVGQLHGRTSFRWNGEDNRRGRKVWFNAADRVMRSEGHFWSTMNYIHHNPVRHGYVKRWQDWPFSSALNYLMEVGDEKAKENWQNFPLKDYGAGWDEPTL